MGERVAIHTSWVAAMLRRRKMQAGPSRLLSTEEPWTPGPGSPCFSGLRLGPRLWRESPGGALGHCPLSCSRAGHELGQRPLSPVPVFGTRHRRMGVLTYYHSRLEGSTPILFSWVN